MAAAPIRAQSLLDTLTGADPKKEKKEKKDKQATTAAIPGQPKAPKAKPKSKTPPYSAAMEDARRKANDKVLVIMGSGRLTAYTQVAEDVANLAESVPDNDIRVIPMIGKNSEQNVRDMIMLKNMDLAIVDQDILELIKKKDPKGYPNFAGRLQYVTKLFPLELHIYAGPDIKSLEDLRGKKVSCQASTAAAMCENLFKTLKIDVQIVYDEDAAGRQRLKKGEVSAAALGATPPLASLEKLTPEDNLHLVPVSEESLPNADVAALMQRYQPAKLRHQDYPALIPQGEYVPTIATNAVLVVYVWPTTTPRYQASQKFVNLLFDNIDSLRKPPRHPRWREVNIAADLPGWKRFPPAQTWLDTKRGAGGGLMASNVVEDDGKVKVAFDKFVEDYAKATGKTVDEKQKNALYPQFIEWWQKSKAQ